MSKKAVKVSEMSEVESKLLENMPESTAIELTVNDEKININIARHLNLNVRQLIVNSVEVLYFAGNTYDKARGDFLMERLLLAAYTGLTFNDDIESFDKFKSTEYYSTIVMNYPPEIKYVSEEIHDTIDYLKQVHAVPSETRTMHEFAGSMFEQVPGVLEKIENLLDGFAAAFSKDGDASFKDMLNALNDLNRKDSAKIAKAVIDYQKEKEAKHQEKASEVI